MLSTKSNSYTFQKDGIWYFSRRVPADLRRHYRTGRIAYSLRTKSIRDARVRAMSDAAKLDRHWHILRISSDDLPGKHLLNDAIQEPEAKASIGDHSLKAAVAIYLRLKGNDRPPTFEAAVRRSCGYLIDCCGMKDLKDYMRSDATKFRVYLFAKGLNGASVARIFGTVRAVMNLALSVSQRDVGRGTNLSYFFAGTTGSGAAAVWTCSHANISSMVWTAISSF